MENKRASPLGCASEPCYRSGVTAAPGPSNSPTAAGVAVSSALGGSGVAVSSALGGSGVAADSDEGERTLYEGHPAVLPSVTTLLIAIVTVGLAAIYFWIRSRSTFVRVTTQRIVVDRGILSKRMDQLDLYRVTDYVVDRPLSQRMMGTGNIILKAMDSTSSQLILSGLKTDVVALYEALRRATEDEKRRRGVRVVDYEVTAQGGPSGT
ncbi:MAG: PH domain-containing protein [Myxococcales bacterium]|nr:PH domain-containing protein [Myxococcales bacterium]